MTLGSLLRPAEQISRWEKHLARITTPGDGPAALPTVRVPSDVAAISAASCFPIIAAEEALGGCRCGRQKVAVAWRLPQMGGAPPQDRQLCPGTALLSPRKKTHWEAQHSHRGRSTGGNVVTMQTLMGGPGLVTAVSDVGILQLQATTVHCLLDKASCMLHILGCRGV